MKLGPWTDRLFKVRLHLMIRGAAPWAVQLYRSAPRCLPAAARVPELCIEQKLKSIELKLLIFIQENMGDMGDMEAGSVTGCGLHEGMKAC